MLMMRHERFCRGLLTAVELIVRFDADLRAIVVLSLGQPHGERVRFRNRCTARHGLGGVPLPWPWRISRGRQCASRFASGCCRAGRLSVAVALRSVGIVRHPVYACRDGHCAVCAWNADCHRSWHRTVVGSGALTAMPFWSMAPRAARDTNADADGAGGIAYSVSRGVRPRHRRSRGHHHRWRKYFGYTRTMTTAIALETSKGNLSFALALGIILIVLSMTVSAASLSLGRA